MLITSRGWNVATGSTNRQPNMSSRAIRLALPVCLGIALLGCHNQTTRGASFRARPDSVKPGSLEGPFTGQVVDSSTGEPVSGAFIYATWTYTTGYGVMSPGHVTEFVLTSDKNGRYKIPAVADLPADKRSGPPPRGGSVRITDFHLVVYKAGYVGYRSDRRFRDFGLRRDFAQRENQVVLERWRAEYSPQRHVRYLGGGSAIANFTRDQAKLAAAELSGEGGSGDRIAAEFAPLIGGGSGIVAAQLLSERQIKSITKYDGSFETGPLGDEPDTSAYSSQHFKALQRDQSYDIARRLWKLSTKGAEKRYTELAELLPKVQEIDEIADRPLRSVENGINGVIFLDKGRGVVVMLTCGAAQCDNADVVTDLARLAHEKLEALMPARGGGQ